MKIFKIHILYFFFSGIIICFISSCSVLEPSIPVASYIHIDSIAFSTDYPTQGSSSKKITDAWVIYDNKYLGTFPLPTDIPLFGEGAHNLIIKGGVWENGISSTRAAYPKYSSYVTDVVLNPKEKILISPAVTYSSGVQFAQIEDFDDASLSLVTTNTAYATLAITQLQDPNAFEGNSGHAILDANHTVLEVASSSAFQLPLNTPSYVELNYKGDNDFTIGAFITTPDGILKTDILSIRASASWKKIYITISTLLSNYLSIGIDYKIYIHADKDQALTTADLYFDNLKVVY